MSKNTSTQGMEPLEKVSFLYEKNKKVINAALFAVLVAVGGYFGYKNFVVKPNEEKASIAMAYAEQLFQIDSVNTALNGNGQNAGFLKIIKKYEGTPSANLAHYYAASCMLKLGDYNGAIKHLKEFDPKGTVLGHAKAGLLGDAYMEIKDAKKAIEFYKEATADQDDDVFTPLYLDRLAVAYIQNNQSEDAIKAYKKIRDDFPRSFQSRDVDRALAMLGVLE